ncbi:hypothetical protein [Rivularia sp. UHCC 0363]|uniref:hypothetical protein n=1 Tax=Rivularia sp. UHCC 0363 TaxID=3110244 RepID=UPI002B1F006C|nr:hypothetical protein [Rivularia sp. UHCC 0363]MEA5594743.1 hypothetical protein [Rivularia sp. UHCC 0363]
MQVFEPRAMSIPVHNALNELRTKNETNKDRLKEQKNQAVELYTYLATWGLMRLKAEEKALKKEGKKEVVIKFFECLALDELSNIRDLAGDKGLSKLKSLNSEEYLGLTGLGLSLAQEFSFWAEAVYHDITGAN